MEVVVRAPTNIAVVKYWGKNPKWEKYHLPNKSSLSITVDGLYTETRLSVKPGSGRVRFVLNGQEIPESAKEYEYVGKYQKVLAEIFREVKKYDWEVISENNFPTAAGFASSASGFAAMVFALAEAFKELEPGFYQEWMADPRKLSVFARLGSGSATRSIPPKGGFVLWERGVDPLNCPSPEEVGKEEFQRILFSSSASSLFPPQHWPELRLIYVRVSGKKKKVKSRAGMKMTVQTNPLYWQWVEYEEKKLLPAVEAAIREKDFEKFSELAMMASNGLHAMMLYTKPRIAYLNDTSQQIIEAVLGLNEEGKTCAYTFDAGPNAVVFVEERNLSAVEAPLAEIVGKENLWVTRPGKGPTRVE